MSKLIMIDQKHRRTRNWLLDVPAWLFIATVMAISIVGFSRAEAANLYNPDFSIKQVGVGTGICSPGPTCWEPPGWWRNSSNSTAYSYGSKTFAEFGIETMYPGGAVALQYRYYHPAVNPKSLRFTGGCSVYGGYFYLIFVDKNKKRLGATALYMPKLSGLDLGYARGLSIIPFNSPVGTAFVVPSARLASAGRCAFDNVYIY